MADDAKGPVREALLPHNSFTAVETGSARSPAWNSERNTSSFEVCAEATCTAALWPKPVVQCGIALFGR